jgi:hypothetical protein
MCSLLAACAVSAARNLGIASSAKSRIDCCSLLAQLQACMTSPE